MLNHTDSLIFMDTAIQKLLAMGKNLKAIEYMTLLSNFYSKRNKVSKSTTKSAAYAQQALYHTARILKGEI